MPRQYCLLLAAALCCFLRPSTACLAGGGPENVLLVVNQNSQDSLTVANFYSRLRDIPASNLLYLDWRDELEWTKRKTFRSKILEPILQAIDKRKLSAQIDYVVYSCDFPWAIKFQGLFPEAKGPKLGRKMASLTGATYLYPFVIQDSPALMDLTTNWYVPDETVKNASHCTQLKNVKTQGFRSRYAWQRGGKRTTDFKQGQRYLMSCMLGVTQARSSTVEEITRSLVASTAADATSPDGAFYFMHNEDIRSKARHKCFESIARQLRAEGAKAKVLKGKLPKKANDVLGLTTGAAQLAISKSALQFRPGAFGDNLTSFGGDFRPSTHQTTLDAFLRVGAAGASGTVIEPYALQAKFPLPSIHLHYYRGCSLAEAYYQSVSAPYQALLVGDPLCQPWARPPNCTAVLPKGSSVSGKLRLSPKLSADASKYEVYVDGRLRFLAKRGKPVVIDTQALPEGHHELRLVAIQKGAIETCGRAVLPISVDNQPAEPLTLSTQPNRRLKPSETLTLRAAGDDDASQLVFLHNSRVIGKARGPEYRLEVGSDQLGRGPVRLIATNPVTGEKSPPVWIWVE